MSAKLHCKALSIVLAYDKQSTKGAVNIAVLCFSQQTFTEFHAISVLILRERHNRVG